MAILYRSKFNAMFNGNFGDSGSLKLDLFSEWTFGIVLKLHVKLEILSGLCENGLD